MAYIQILLGVILVSWIGRVRRYRYHMGGGSLAVLLIWILIPVLAIRRFPSFAFVTILLNVILFACAWFPRRRVVLNWPKVMKPIQYAEYAIVAVIIVMRWTGHTLEAVGIGVPVGCALQGLLYWAVTDDMFELWTWLVHPLEYGESPDDIRLWHMEFTEWTDGKMELIKFWQYRFDDKRYIAITGPVTFSIDDGTFSTLAEAEVVRRYKEWFNTEHIEKITAQRAEA